MASLYLTIAFLSLATWTNDPATLSTEKETRILYVGNSLTYANDLPGLVAGIAKQDDITITYSSYCFPDYSLEDHWNEGKVKTEIEKGSYDFVVVQQGPSALEESRKLLVDYTTRLSDLCKKHNAKLAVYMVWPSKARSFDHDNVIRSYSEAAGQTGALLCPAGLAWKYAWQSDPALPLYSEDNFHPSLTGSVLAALTVYGSLAGKNDLDFVKHGNSPWKDAVTAEYLDKLKGAALKAISQ